MLSTVTEVCQLNVDLSFLQGQVMHADQVPVDHETNDDIRQYKGSVLDKVFRNEELESVESTQVLC